MTTTEPLESLPGGKVCFGCGPDVECFTACCAKLNLMLTPYDVLRLSRRLDMSTTDFLDAHTFAIEEKGKLPRIRLEMGEEDRRCPFVSDQGCTVYEDRPSACRAYPLARAATRSPLTNDVKEAFFVVREDHCKGFGQGREWTGEEWCSNQGLEDYNRHNDDWMDVLTNQADVVYGQEAERRTKMFNLASYDLDMFRRFVLESGLVTRLDISDRRVEQLTNDDVALLRFAMQWLRFALYGTRFNPERA